MKFHDRYLIKKLKINNCYALIFNNILDIEKLIVPLKFLICINRLFKGKLHEIIDYLEGYIDPYQKSSKGEK